MLSGSLKEIQTSYLTPFRFTEHKWAMIVELIGMAVATPVQELANPTASPRG
jgi:hypothetical protein